MLFIRDSIPEQPDRKSDNKRSRSFATRMQEKRHSDFIHLGVIPEMHRNKTSCAQIAGSPRILSIIFTAETEISTNIGHESTEGVWPNLAPEARRHCYMVTRNNSVLNEKAFSSLHFDGLLYRGYHSDLRDPCKL